LLNSKRNKNTLKPGEWYCPNCNILNFSCRTICIRCNTDKPLSFEKGEKNGFAKERKLEVKDSNKKEYKDGKHRRISKRNDVKQEEFKKNKKSRERSRERFGRESESQESGLTSSGYSKSYDRSPTGNKFQENVNTSISQNPTHQSQPNAANFVENIINIAKSLTNFATNNSALNNVNQQNIGQQNVFCPNYNQGGTIPLQTLVQSFLGILSQKMDQRSFYEFSNTFIGLINQYIMNGSVSN
jgi:hypothetical protein